MALNLQFSTGYRNALLDQFETTAGTSVVIEIWTGTQPANCGTADSGTKLASFTLDADWMAAAASGAKAGQKGAAPLSGSNFYTTTGLAAGTAGYFRLKPSSPTSTNAVAQGTVGTSGTDMIIDNASIAVGQNVNITGFTLTAPGA